MQALLTWSRENSPISGSVPGPNPILAVVCPVDFKGECVAAPLHADDGPVGVVLMLSARSPFTPSDRALLARLTEPIGVALANTARVHELKRLRESPRPTSRRSSTNSAGMMLLTRSSAPKRVCAR